MKTALCIKKDKSIKNLSHVCAATHFVMPREGDDSCETNPHVWQLLPYVVLYRYARDGEDSLDLEFLTYRRGASSTEKRLTSKYSIGFGGHVDVHPAEGVSMWDHLTAECCRELKEELGIQTTPDIYQTVRATLGATSRLIIPTNESTGVEVYHLGILIYINATDIKLGDIEEGHIDELKWMTKEQMVDKFYVINSEEHKLENWSDYAFQQLQK